jgi:hypothetical protein
MASNSPHPNIENGDNNALPAGNTGVSAFYGFLQQALTLGAQKVRPSVLPQLIGFLAYVALVGLFGTSLLWNRPKVTAAAIVMLMLVGVMAILLLLNIGKKIHSVVANAILLLAVSAFLAIAAYAVVKLLGGKSPEALMAELKQECMGGSASACSELDKRVQLTCGYDAACIGRAQCWQNKSRALVLIENVCNPSFPNYNAQSCAFQRQNVGQQAKADCDSF